MRPSRPPKCWERGRGVRIGLAFAEVEAKLRGGEEKERELNILDATTSRNNF